MATPRLALLLLAALALAAVPPAAGHESSNHGTIKVHDEAVVDPAMQNQPHVSCQFWIEGFNMAEDSGSLVWRSWPPTGDMSVALTANWTADASEGNGTTGNEDGFHFLAGPFGLPNGHYKVEAWLDGDEHKAKSKVFWVHPCDEHEMPPCPTTFLAVANGDGSVTLSWTPPADVDGFVLYRAEGDEDFEDIAIVNGTTASYTDDDTIVGVTYTYTIVSFEGDVSSGPCDEVEVTTIPNFPTLAAFGLAILGGSVAYASLRRRK